MPVYGAGECLGAARLLSVNRKDTDNDQAAAFWKHCWPDFAFWHQEEFIYHVVVVFNLLCACRGHESASLLIQYVFGENKVCGAVFLMDESAGVEHEILVACQGAVEK